MLLLLLVMVIRSTEVYSLLIVTIATSLVADWCEYYAAGITYG